MVQPAARKWIIDPFQWFFQRESSGGIILFLAALTALIWANSPWKEAYFALWHIQFHLGFDGFGLSLPLHSWINDGLMAIFFLLVGLEIKRELLVGELSPVRQALLPILAAVGGMIVPALLYMAFNPPGSNFNAGWGIPTVTDIAFSLGVLALLGQRVPLFLKIFLTALAIVDDLGAVLIIALFYSHGLNWHYIGLAALIVGLLFLLNRLKCRWLPLYIILGLILWVMMLHSGIHTTVAGVLLALTIPARSKIKVDSFYSEGLSVLHTLRNISGHPNEYSILTEDDYQTGVQNIETLCDEAQAPMQRVEHALHPWVTYAIMPLFAFANAGVTFSTGTFVQSLTHPITLGILAGLIIGKTTGIALFSWLSVQLRLAELPEGIKWIHMIGLACLGGIGFTMSLFIAGLAFQGHNTETAKIGIFLGSLLSGFLGWLILKKTLVQLIYPNKSGQFN
jgi:NhaA family Na+:H+ antiporter